MPEKPDHATRENAVAYFDNHAEYYESSQYRTTRRTFVNARQDRLVSIVAATEMDPASAVLDAGCGPGNLLYPLASRCGHLCAMDASPRMLDLARRNGKQLANVTYQVGSIDALPFADASFDLVCSAGVIEYLEHCTGAMKEMHRVLRPGGLLILSTTNILAPAHWFRPLLQPIARLPIVARAFGIKPATFRLHYAFIPNFKKRLRSLGFALEEERHFYLTLPRPLDRMLPGVARRIESFFDGYMDTAVRHLAEGYIALARKPD